MFTRSWAKSSQVKEILFPTSNCWSSSKSDLTMSGCRPTRPRCPGRQWRIFKCLRIFFRHPWLRSKDKELTFSGQAMYLVSWRSSIFFTTLCQQVPKIYLIRTFSIILPSRTIFSLILGSDEDRLKAPEGLYHWRIRQSNPYQRLAKPIFQLFECFF